MFIGFIVIIIFIVSVSVIIYMDLLLVILSLKKEIWILMFNCIKLKQ